MKIRAESVKNSHEKTCGCTMKKWNIAIVAITSVWLISLCVLESDWNPERVDLEGVYYYDDQMLDIRPNGEYLYQLGDEKSRGMWTYDNFRLLLIENKKDYRVIKYRSTFRLLDVEKGSDPDLWNIDKSFKMSIWRRSLFGRVYAAIKFLIPTLPRGNACR